ncbi:hypothetical protein E3Q22_00034 [Wallemia mellicola]|uniref:ER transporter 6TM N-terminal domain-containing protein n=2 Tax=Wallemia mellicola TaxID=1708541 RepID=I4YJZ2_WALMC|nr:hypothetical protein WALSEDRAFT_59187 [Wallemia mellicola CBS 633.66]EIM24284.1 hypothetical protein WALSEDRAFT_59187 [Wallemia mellicola CBS 633.66]TIB82755.1 hypothetical protein E3Q22_00034 [Wallemia mellicola]|eukprot:XP_006956097.1 hypothetical protein WALSEDRAFT_59187 [Wallemia mellicola CBS 633.66]
MEEDHPLPSAVANLRENNTRSGSGRSNRSVTFSIQDDDINENAVVDTESEDERDGDDSDSGHNRRRSSRLDDTCIGNPEKVNADLETQAKDESNEETPPAKQSPWQRFLEMKYVRWMHVNHSWHHFRPIIRASLAAWLGLLLFLIQPVLERMGQAAFYILVCGFLASPRDAIVPDIERQIINLVFVCSAWAWAVIGLAIGFAGRDDALSEATMAEIMDEANALNVPNVATYIQQQTFEGRFIQTSTSIAAAIFLASGCGFFLYLKSILSPPRYGVACVFSAICLIVSLTQGHLTYSPNYLIGSYFALPLALQSAINILCSIFVLPVTVNHQFLIGLQAVLQPLQKFVQAETDMLGIPVTSEDWIERVKYLKQLNSQSVQAMIAVRTKDAYIFREYSFGLLRGRDCHEMLELIRVVHLRSGGFLTFCEALLVAFHNRHILQEAVTIADPSEMPHATASLYGNSRNPSPYSSQPGTPRSSVALSRHDTGDSRDNDSHHSGLHIFGSHSIGTLTEMLTKKKHVAPIGVFESQRYMALEQQLKFTDQEFVRAHFKIVNAESKELNEITAATIAHIHTQIDRIDKVRLGSWIFRRKDAPSEGDAIVQNMEVCDNLRRAIDKFKNEDRLAVLKNYEKFFDGSQPKKKIPYRALFWSFSYQYHLLSFCSALLEVVEKISNLEAKRKKPRLWIPEVHLFGWFTSGAHKHSEEEEEDDDDPDHMSGVLDIFPQSRDPDVLEPSNIFERFGLVLWKIWMFFTSTGSLFALKTAVLVGLVTLPSFLKQSTSWYYYDRGLWVAIMAIMTHSQHRGDTLFNWFTRLVYSVVGIFGGLLIWSIAAQKGTGNAYAVGATCAVAFPIMFYIVMYFPGTSVGMMVLMTSVAMVLGYSWQDSHNPNLVNVGWGWELSWRRLLLVLIGVTSAFVFAYVPPVSSAKRHQRLIYSRTITTIANSWCAIVGYALNSHHREIDEEAITKTLLSVKSKLRKSKARQDFAAFEFSLRGKWPRKRYEALLNVQLDLVELLSQFLTVAKQLDPLWTKGVMNRSRFNDHRFIGDVLACFEMCATSIKTGMPLPQITPCPLVGIRHSAKLGLSLSANDEDVPEGLPLHIDFNVLKSEEYWLYCVAYSLSQSILIRVDRMMLYTKSLVGEQFHINLEV